MPIQYRCRCGQEVVLRPKEGYFLVAGLILGVTLLNLALTTFLWYRVESDSQRPASIADLGTRANGSSDLSAEQVSADPTLIADPIPEVAPRDPTIVAASEGWTQARAAEKASAGEVVDLSASRVVEGAVASGIPTETPVSGLLRSLDLEEEGTPVPATYQLPRPEDLDGLSLWARLADLPSDPTHRARVLLAGMAWGSGHLRVRAHQEWDRLGLPDWKQLRGSAASMLELETQDELARRIHDGWRESWVVNEDGEDAWIRAARVSLSPAEDRVLLVDLSASMASEIEHLVQALRVIVPLTLAGERRRWGWIGYRDELVERFPPTSDGEAFLASLETWRCEGGGDVPEGVDRALFEALRFGSFEWAKGANRRLLLVGDAPPPFDRIAGMTTLMRAAHGSPEAFGLGAIGIVREPELFKEVPSFAELVSAGGGQVEFLAPGGDLAGPLWRQITGGDPPWDRSPLQR